MGGMGWGESREATVDVSARHARALDQLSRAAAEFVAAPTTGNHERLATAVAELDKVTGGKPAAVPNSPWPPRPPTIDGTVITTAALRR